jgi:hypothetical protein
VFPKESRTRSRFYSAVSRAGKRFSSHIFSKLRLPLGHTEDPYQYASNPLENCYPLTAYRTHGDRIALFGYGTFDLTVAPYDIISIVNLATNLVRSEYTAVDLVHCCQLDSWMADCWADVERLWDLYVIGLTVEQLTCSRRRQGLERRLRGMTSCFFEQELIKSLNQPESSRTKRKQVLSYHKNSPMHKNAQLISFLPLQLLLLTMTLTSLSRPLQYDSKRYPHHSRVPKLKLHNHERGDEVSIELIESSQLMDMGREPHHLLRWSMRHIYQSCLDTRGVGSSGVGER